MNTAYLSLGSNEGDRQLWLQKAMELLAHDCGTTVSKSSLYETAAWGITTQPDFLNMALQLQTTLTPSQLITAILNIETSLGRQRTIKWGPRIIDIDILFYNDVVLQTPDLTIPHPFLQDRRFILAPLAEIAPTYMHPVFNKTVTQLLTDCTDNLEVHKYN
jgi:2-amino-4-hydroxy-6-hydroxymethyldihydropteridine diphosphokinase